MGCDRRTNPPPLLHALTADVGAVFLRLGVGSVVSVLRRRLRESDAAGGALP